MPTGGQKHKNDESGTDNDATDDGCCKGHLFLFFVDVVWARRLELELKYLDAVDVHIGEAANLGVAATYEVLALLHRHATPLSIVKEGTADVPDANVGRGFLECALQWFRKGLVERVECPHEIATRRFASIILGV